MESSSQANNQNALVEDNENFKKLVNLVDKLRDVGLNDHISMPRIAVCGSQSSGKSSLLESIVGLNFLPRGSGVVTRRPLELRLVRSKNLNEAPFGLFKIDGDKKYTDFNKIRERIEGLTDELCGSNKGIVDDPIVLQIFSPNCPDLTVIDLPGITRIPIGSQPKNIEQITKEMVTRYCKDDRTIILAVIPANADMTTSEALQLAQQLDPQGIRTIGVITKIDIMDKGTDARSMLLNKEISLRLGYIGVKGRSQEDITNKVAVHMALKSEMDYFMNHPAYRHMPRELLGTQSLVVKLTTVMYDHMKNVLPSILREINHKIKNCEANISKLGTPIPEDSKEKLDAIWRDISVFYEKFKSNIKGEFTDDPSNSENNKVKVLASAQISILFNNLYKNYLNRFNASIQYRDADIDRIVGMYTGNTLPGFLSVDCFIALLSPLLEKLRMPAIELLEKIYLILKTVGSTLINETFQKMFALKEVLLRLFNEVLDEVS
jgi:GTP-binding protein EngB required for normal cell division